MSFGARLSELGIELPEVAAPLASYIPAKRSGNYVYTSGQLPLVGGELIASGKVGAEVDEATAQECARVCILNALAAVAVVVGGLDNIRSIVKVVGFVASDPSFSGQPAVINGASDLLGEIFGDAGSHARSAVGVSVLPKDAPVEIEMIVEVAEERWTFGLVGSRFTPEMAGGRLRWRDRRQRWCCVAAHWSFFSSAA